MKWSRSEHFCRVFWDWGLFLQPLKPGDQIASILFFISQERKLRPCETCSRSWHLLLEPLGPCVASGKLLSSNKYGLLCLKVRKTLGVWEASLTALVTSAAVHSGCGQAFALGRLGTVPSPLLPLLYSAFGCFIFKLVWEIRASITTIHLVLCSPRWWAVGPVPGSVCHRNELVVAPYPTLQAADGATLSFKPRVLMVSRGVLNMHDLQGELEPSSRALLCSLFPAEALFWNILPVLLQHG